MKLRIDYILRQRGVTGNCRTGLVVVKNRPNNILKD